MAGSSSALVWVTRRVAGGDDGAPFRAARADDEIELRAVDADHVGAGIVVTARDVIGHVTVPRELVTAVGCAAVDAERWDLVVVAGARRAIGHGTPASVAALARELARELAVPYVDHGVALTPPVPRRWSASRPVEQLLIAYTPPWASLVLAVPLAAIILALFLAAVLGLGDLATFGAFGLVAFAMWRLDAARALRRHRQQVVLLGRHGLQLRTGTDDATFPLASVERFVPRPGGADLATVAAICDGREVELITTHDPDRRDTHAIVTRLNVELDQLRASGDRGRR